MYNFCEKTEFSYATIVFKYADLSLSLSYQKAEKPYPKNYT